MKTLLQGWRTHIVMGLLAALGIYDQLAPDQVHTILLSLGIPEVKTGAVVTWIAVVGIALRSITTTPTGQKAAS